MEKHLVGGMSNLALSEYFKQTLKNRYFLVKKWHICQKKFNFYFIFFALNDCFIISSEDVKRNQVWGARK